MRYFLVTLVDGRSYVCRRPPARGEQIASVTEMEEGRGLRRMLQQCRDARLPGR